jgi:hypothetical protein
MSRRCSVVVGNGSKSRRTKNGWHHLTTDKGWRRTFDEPIPLPRGRELVTLKDAGTYITKLPKAEHEAPEWQAAMQALILVATSGGPTMLARIGIMRALNRHVERVFEPSGKKHHWEKRKLKRDERTASAATPSCACC